MKDANPTDPRATARRYLSTLSALLHIVWDLSRDEMAAARRACPSAEAPSRRAEDYHEDYRDLAAALLEAGALDEGKGAPAALPGHCCHECRAYDESSEEATDSTGDVSRASTFSIPALSRK